MKKCTIVFTLTETKMFIKPIVLIQFKTIPSLRPHLSYLNALRLIGGK